jgi:hypothetical protein
MVCIKSRLPFKIFSTLLELFEGKISLAASLQVMLQLPCGYARNFSPCKTKVKIASLPIEGYQTKYRSRCINDALF